MFENNNALKPVNTEAIISRQAQEVQAAMVVAKKFPRDQQASFERIIKTCERKTLAEAAIYEYPRGGTKIEGPSIRLAEAIAQNWGNMDFGIVELEQINGESTVMAYAWDLETNTRSSKIFTVKHERKAKNKITKLTDPRDIYELVANMGARRLRASILAVVPGDVIDAAVAQCKQTLIGAIEGEGSGIEETRAAMVTAFEKFKVTQKMMEKKIGCNLEAFTPGHIVKLKSVYQSLKDGMAGPEAFFDLTDDSDKANTENIDIPKEVVEKKQEEPKEPETPKEPLPEIKKDDEPDFMKR